MLAFAFGGNSEAALADSETMSGAAATAYAVAREHAPELFRTSVTPAPKSGKVVDAFGVLEEKGGDRALSESAKPRFARQDDRWVPIDTELVDHANGWAPRAAATDLVMPTTSAHDVELSDIDLSIGLGGVRDMPGAAVGGAVVYAGVHPAVDAIVQAEPDGVEVSWILRDASARRNLDLDLDLADDDQLVSAGRGFEIRRGGTTQATVSAPRAWDAADRPVSVEPVRTATGVRYVVSPQADTKYPIVVDPAVRAGDNPDVFSGAAEWDSDGGMPWPGGSTFAGGCEFFGTAASMLVRECDTEPEPGRYFYSELRWQAPGTSFVTRLDIDDYRYLPDNGGYGGCVYAGIRANGADEAGFAGREVDAGGSGAHLDMDPRVGTGVGCESTRAAYVTCVEADCGRGGTPGNTAFFGISWMDTGTGHEYGQAEVSVTRDDADRPTVAWDDAPALAWKRSGIQSATVSAQDTGLGVKSLRVDQTSGGTAADTSTSTARCAGTTGSPCPATWNGRELSRTLTYDVANLDEGVTTVKAQAEDVVGNASSAPATWTLGVDRSAPVIDLGAGVVAGPTVGGTIRRSLMLSVTDGTPNGTAAQRRAGVKEVVVSVSGKVGTSAATTYSEQARYTPAAGCGADSCGVSKQHVFDPAGYAPGTYKLRVDAIDLVGNTRRETTSFKIIDPSGAGDEVVPVPDVDLTVAPCSATPMRFDVSGVALGAQVSAAQVSLKVEAGRTSTAPASVHLANADGTPGPTVSTIAWLDGGARALVDVTSAVQSWVTRTKPNNGLVVCFDDRGSTSITLDPSSELKIFNAPGTYGPDQAGEVFEALFPSSVASDDDNALTDTGDAYVTADGKRTIPKDPNEPIALDTEGGTLEVTTEGVKNSAADGGLVGDAAVVYPQAEAGTDHTTRAVDEGVETFTVIHDDEVGKGVELSFDLPGEERLVKQQDGTVAVVDPTPPQQTPSTPKPADIPVGSAQSDQLKEAQGLDSSIPDADPDADEDVADAVEDGAGDVVQPTATQLDDVGAGLTPDAGLAKPCGGTCDEHNAAAAGASKQQAQAQIQAGSAETRDDVLEELDERLEDNAGMSARTEALVAEAASDEPRIVASVKDVWAKDANGDAVPTEVEVDGNRLTVSVEPDEDTVFPVIVDPYIAWSQTQLVYEPYPIYRNEIYFAGWAVHGRHVGWTHVGYCWVRGYSCANWGNGWSSITPPGAFAQFTNAWTWYPLYTFYNVPVYLTRTVFAGWGYTPRWKTVTNVYWFASTWSLFGGPDGAVNTPAEVQALKIALRDSTDWQVEQYVSDLSDAQLRAFVSMYLQFFGGNGGQWVDPAGNPSNWPPTATAAGWKSYLMKLATRALAAALRHGGDEVKHIVKYVDRDAAKLVDRYSDEIADALDDIAKIPGLTSNIVKKKLYTFLVNQLGMQPKLALQIADGVKRALEIVAF